MKRENRLRSRMVQFGYDHQGIDRELKKVRNSTKEVSKMLDNMIPKPEKQEEEKEN